MYMYSLRFWAEDTKTSWIEEYKIKSDTESQKIPLISLIVLYFPTELVSKNRTTWRDIFQSITVEREQFR